VEMSNFIPAILGNFTPALTILQKKSQKKSLIALF